MSEESDFLKSLRDASIRTAVEQLRILQRLKESRSACQAAHEPCDSTTGDGDGATRGTDSSVVADFLFDAARLQLNAYNNLLGLSAKYSDQIIERLRALTYSGRPKSSPLRLKLIVSGTAGEEACASSPFTIQNRLSTRAQISLSISEFHNLAGGPYFTPQMGFRTDPPRPDDRSLDPGTQRSFVLSLKLDPPFQPGQQYAGEVYVMLHGRIVEVVDVQVSVTGPPSPPPPPTPKSPASAPAKRTTSAPGKAKRRARSTPARRGRAS